jgi:hypothetical protein
VKRDRKREDGAQARASAGIQEYSEQMQEILTVTMRDKGGLRG